MKRDSTEEDSRRRLDEALSASVDTGLLQSCVRSFVEVHNDELVRAQDSFQTPAPVETLG